MRLYSLDAKDKSDGTSFRTLEDILQNKKKRRILMSGDTIKELDDLTAIFSSFEDLNESFNDAYQSNLEMYDPIIIVDVSDNLKDSYAINDIVYKEDKKRIDDPDYIKGWLLEYLMSNPQDINLFKGIRNIYKSQYPTEFELGIVTETIINQVVLSYFRTYSYKKYRDIYFSLKKLDNSKVKKNEIHR